MPKTRNITKPTKTVPTPVQQEPNRGNWKEGDKPSDFTGIWADDDRTVTSVRAAARPETGKPADLPKRTERIASNRHLLVYHDPRQWDKDITTGGGDEEC